jgi:sphinganine-1-phosphate aldolase
MMFKLAPPAPPTRDALAAVGALVISYHVASAALSLLRGRSLTELVVGGAVAAARALPLASAALDAGLDSALDGLRDELAPASAESLLALPRAGRRASAVAAELRAALAHDAARNGLARGTAFGGIYHALGGGGAAPPLHALHADVSAAFLDTNQLYPGLFSTARRVEAEAVAMAVALLRDGCGGEGGGGGGGDARAPAACGLFTSGGTESVILAVKAHRDAALAALGFVGGALPPLVAAARAGRVLNVVAGATAHPALDKACALLGLRLKKVPVGAPDFALAPAAARAALDADTVLLFASAPGFAHGVVDDVPALGAAAAAFAGSPFGRAGVPLHVDNCLGGLLLSFTPGAPPFDFRASPAVASVSMDLHKFAGAPKGASVVAFRDPARRRMAYSATADYPGGLYATPTLAGSRSGAAGALAWATLVATGADGLARAAARVARVHAALARGVAAIPHLALLGRPAACVVAFAPAPGARFSIFALAARMAALRGWRLALLQAPAGAHVVVTERFDEPWEGGAGGGEGAGGGDGALTVGEAWLRDLAACAAAAQAQPADPRFEGQGEAAIYGAAGVLPRGEVGEILRRYCDVLTVVR